MSLTHSEEFNHVAYAYRAAPHDTGAVIQRYEALCSYVDGLLAAKDTEIASLKQQLATCCQLASMASKQAEAFATVIDEAKLVPAGYWENERAR